MIKTVLCTHIGVALLMTAAPCFVYAQCQTGNCATGNSAAGNCASGQCSTGHCGVGGGGCLGRFLTLHHGDSCNSGAYNGECLTCENIWDGYCESKAKCLPRIQLPHPKSCPLDLHLGAVCGACDPCAPGVGLYGRRTTCCPPRHHHLFTRLFHKKSCCDDACCHTRVATPGCDACAGGVEVAPAATSDAGESGAEEVIQQQQDEPEVVPPAPTVLDQTSTVRPKSFDWLQRALQLN